VKACDFNNSRDALLKTLAAKEYFDQSGSFSFAQHHFNNRNDMVAFHLFWFSTVLLILICPLSPAAAQQQLPPPNSAEKFTDLQDARKERHIAHSASQEGATRKKALFPFSRRDSPRQSSSLFKSGSSTKSKQKKATDLIHRQDPTLVIPRVLDQATPKNVSILISLMRQRIYLKVGEEIAIDAPLSSGKVAGMTPKGQFTILEKDADHRSSVYGNFVDANGEVVRAGVSLKIDSAPSGTTYVGAPMKWFMRLTWQGVGMHAGILPGYPASHGCIRLPEETARIIYNCVRIGTRVIVAE